MKPINIYALTRIRDTDALKKLERQMSGRKHQLKIKEWEVADLKKLIERLADWMPDMRNLDFYYSFSLPKLGKEFDLLRISENLVVNIELKSREVSDEAIRKQLMKNRYYLAMLGKNIASFTYISSQDRLVRLTNSEKLIDTDWERLCTDLLKQENCYEDEIESLFSEDKFLISPLTDPGRFLRKEYFLTSQQRDIEKKILKCVGQRKGGFYGFTGLPGTGKTILLYDLAMQLSWKKRVCVLHFGSWPKELHQLNHRLKRVDFYSCKRGENICIREEYSAIFVDEGHRMSEEAGNTIYTTAVKRNLPVIFSYDTEDAIAAGERIFSGEKLIEQIPGYQKFRLTNRIRVNGELSSFIHCVMQPYRYHHRKSYPSIRLAYANTKEEAVCLLNNFKYRGYTYIRDERMDVMDTKDEKDMEVEEATCKEFENVVMLLDKTVTYHEEGWLVTKESHGDGKTNDSRVRCLFHGLSRAKNKIALVVYGNEEVFLEILKLFGGGE